MADFFADGRLFPQDIQALENANYIDEIYSNNGRDNHILKQDFEKIVYSPEFKVLGCLNGYLFSSEGAYVAKYTLDGLQIAKINLETVHGTFYEGCKHFYCWFENVLYKVTEQLEIEWSKEFDLNIASTYIDYRGDCYILFESSRTIRKILKSGEESVYIDGSDNPEHDVILYRIFITKGGGWLYVLGTEHYGYNNTMDVFIDKYNTRTWEKVDRLIESSTAFVSENDTDYQFIDFVLSGDYYYLLAKTNLIKINIKGMHYWHNTNYMFEYKPMAFTDSTYSDHFYLSSNSSNAREEGCITDHVVVYEKIDGNGNTIWNVSLTTDDDIDFSWASYREKLYISMRAYVEAYKEYILSVNDDEVLFHTRNNKLIKVIKYNSEEIFSADNYYGMRLLASEIKDGIEKTEYSPLLHDDGDMINEDEDLLLLPLENEHYTDLDNYEYKYLLASQYRLDPPEVSLLYTKSLQPMLTKLKNVIKTKAPIIPDTVHEFITNPNGVYLDTSRDFDLVRARFRYSFDKYLLADLNMFSDEIITKKLGYTIITKKYGHDIIMKTRKIYSYVFGKYSEMDMIAQWLKENGVMDTNLPDIVEELRHHTYDAIQDIQIAGTPQIYDVNAYKQFEYTFDGNKYINNTWGTQIFSCTNLPWDKRKCIAKIYIDSLANIIKKQEMRPIIFFLNGKAIPWSDCTIVRDWSYSYLLIKNHDPYETELSSIIFPCDIRYGEDNNVLDEDQVNGYFYFDDEGKSLYFEDRENTAIRVEVIDRNVWGSPTTETPFAPDGTSLFEVMNKQDQKASQRNLIVFEEGLLFPEARHYMMDKGKDVFEYIRTEPLDVMVKAFYWIKANAYYGLEEKPKNQALMLDLKYDEAIYGGPTYTGPEESNIAPLSYEHQYYEWAPSPITVPYVPFNFRMKRSNTYEQNIADAVSYILQYDASLFKDYWKKLSIISTFVYDGEYIINRVPKDGGWLLMPRSRKSNFDDYIIVFRNNRLYEYYKEIDYTDCYFKIPIFNHIERTDTLEIIHFKNINNNYYTMTVNKDEPDYLPEDIRYNDFLLSGNSPSTEDVYIPFNRETSIQYDIGFSYRNNFENNKYKNTDIVLNDEFYYGKEINVYSKRQFHYMYYNIFSPKHEINLSPDFRFCHDKSKYMVFLNGRKLPDECWKLNIMSNEVNRKYISIEFGRYFYTSEGDLVEIFYLPISRVVDPSGQISASHTDGDFDKSLISIYSKDKWYHYNTIYQQFGFDKELYNVYCNGEKINISSVDNIHNSAFAVDNSVLNKIMENSDDWFTLLAGYFGEPQSLSARFTSAPMFDLETYTIPEYLLGRIWAYSDLWSYSFYEDEYNLHLVAEERSESSIREALRNAVIRSKR